MAAENFKVKKGLEVGTGITANSDGINVTGIITATQYRGDGSGLTGVVASGTGVIVKDEGSAVGTAGTFNFVGSGVAATLSAGTATVTISSGGLNDIVDDTTPQLGGNLDLNSKFITGSGNIDITGSLDVSGISTTGFLEVGNLTNGRVPYAGSASGRLVDSANLTFDGTSLFVSGINVTSAGTTSTFGADIVTRNFKATGISTFNDLVNISNLRLQTSGTIDLIQSYSNGGFEIENNIGIRLQQTGFPNHEYASFSSSGGVTLRHNNQIKLTTTSSGITVPDLEATGTGTFGQIETDGVTLGTNNNTFAAKFVDNAVANFGTDNDLKISHDNTDAIFENTTGQFIFKDTAGEAEFKIQAHEGNQASLFLFADEGDDPDDRWRLTAHTDGNLVLNYWRSATNTYAKTAQFANNGGTQLFHTAVKKFETNEYGVVITGVATATSFSGSGAGLTNIPDSALSAVTASKLTGALPSLDGSALTGIVASGSGVIVQHDGSNVGTAGTINWCTTNT